MSSDATWCQPGSTVEARTLQERLRHRVRLDDDFGDVRWIAGLDAHYARRAAICWGAAVLLRADGLELVESVLASAPLNFPYVPGLLSFREAPALLAALDLLSVRPDLVLVDGQGIAHPRRLGIASHIGVLADLPTIGVAKSRLIGDSDEPRSERGAAVPLLHQGERIGTVLRTRTGVRPLYVSPGHRVSFETAARWTLNLAPRFRIPEPTRLADRLSRVHVP